MAEQEPAGATALVTGASRGFGRGIASALRRAGAQVVGVARDRAPLEQLRAELGGGFTAVAADAADPTVAGSPLSGGCAGAKATQRFITGYAQAEANRAGLDLTFTAALPQITPLTDLGGPAVRAYAARAGQSLEAYLQQLGEPLTAARAGQAVVELVTGAAHDQGAYLLTAAGLRPLP